MTATLNQTQLDGWWTVGTPPLVLQGEYDRDQLWLEFMRGTIIRAPSDEGLGVSDSNAIKYLRKINPHGFARCPNDARRMYMHEQGVEQFGLPFHEHRRVSTKEWKKIVDADYPGWEKNRDGHLLAIRTQGDRPNIEMWCDLNCTGRYRLGPGVAVFANARDCAMARISGI